MCAPTSTPFTTIAGIITSVLILTYPIDGIISDGAEDNSFDTLWHSEGRLLPDGYVVFEAIPFRSCAFLRPKTRRGDSCWPAIHA